MTMMRKLVRSEGQGLRAAGSRAVERLESRVLLSAAVTSALANVSVNPSATPTTVDLSTHFDDSTIGAGDTTVLVQTTNGNIPIELFNSVAPNTVTNFLRYVDGGLYNGVIFHRVIQGFVDQTGGFKTDGSAIPTFGTVNNEFHLSNTAGTIAMAKLGGDPNSATDQWFINLGDNSSNLDNQNGGFTVFAKVLYNGMNVATGISHLPTVNGSSLNPQFDNTVPVQNSSVPNPLAASNLVVMNNVSTVPHVGFTAVSDNPGLVTPTVGSDGKTLSLAYAPGQTGWAHVTVTATDLGGGTVSQTFRVNVGTTGDVVNVVAGTGGHKAVAVQQADGTVVTVALKGPGAATLQVSGDTLNQASQKNGTLLVTGTNAAVAKIATTGTTGASTLNITTKGGKVATIAGLSTDADLGTINGKTSILSGNLSAGGSIKTLNLKGATNGTITIGAGALPLTFKSATAVTGESLHSSAPIANITVPSWDGVSNTTSSITAPSIGTFNARGGLANTTVTLSGPGTELNKLVVPNAISSVIINASGNIKSITAGSMADSQIFAGVGTLPSGQPLPNFPTDIPIAASISTVKVQRTFSNTNIAAQNLGRLSLGKVQTTNAGKIFGAAGHVITALTGVDATTGKKFSLKNLTSTAQSTAMEDFVVKVL